MLVRKSMEFREERKEGRKEVVQKLRNIKMIFN